ncbi:hypothetical protein NDU88_001035 [Pleurodeles waltl]|uniref:Uncharacterized protein n=1 Tax=Pleurodeles waltl TaxID=8319 RepID=A0AAV7NDL8_PLEWA|nr:hypothetical protein NDU88_001035 [Pleurodeles waltl]
MRAALIPSGAAGPGAPSDLAGGWRGPEFGHVLRPRLAAGWGRLRTGGAAAGLELDTDLLGALGSGGNVLRPGVRGLPNRVLARPFAFRSLAMLLRETYHLTSERMILVMGLDKPSHPPD